MSNSSGIRFRDTEFWITHRRREYGPFDYEWSKDFNGIELMFQGEKFGEYCSSAEIYADLKQFRLPMRVVEVAAVVMGSILFGLLNGLSSAEKESDLLRRLEEHGLRRFADGIGSGPSAK